MTTIVSEDNTPLVTRNTETKVYKRRWYILLIFSLVAVLQGKLIKLKQFKLKLKFLSKERLNLAIFCLLLLAYSRFIG